MGTSHRFHQKNNTMGVLSEDARTFTKRSNKACLSFFFSVYRFSGLFILRPALSCPVRCIAMQGIVSA